MAERAGAMRTYPHIGIQSLEKAPIVLVKIIK